MRKNLSLSCALSIVGLALSTVSAAAQEARPDPVDGHEIMQLQQQIAILTQQLKVAQLQKQIRDADAKDDDTNKATLPSAAQTAPAPTPAPARATAAVAPPAPPPLPQVVSISGAGSHLTAVLLLPTGGEVVAYPAMGLPGGLTVHDVSPNGVHVMSGGDLVDLPFQGSGSAPLPAQAPSPAPSFIQLPTTSSAPFAPPPGPAMSR